MQDQLPKKQVYKDDWDTDFREAYEDRGSFRPLKVKKHRTPNRWLGSIGGFLIVGGVCWATYLLTSGHVPYELIKFPGPVYVAGAGLLFSILAKYLG